jgi:hypothetical protein
MNDYPVAAATIEGATNSQQYQPSLRDWRFLLHSTPALMVFENQMQPRKST